MAHMHALNIKLHIAAAQFNINRVKQLARAQYINLSKSLKMSTSC